MSVDGTWQQDCHKDGRSTNLCEGLTSVTACGSKQMSPGNSMSPQPWTAVAANCRCSLEWLAGRLRCRFGIQCMRRVTLARTHRNYLALLQTLHLHEVSLGHTAAFFRPGERVRLQTPGQKQDLARLHAISRKRTVSFGLLLPAGLDTRLKSCHGTLSYGLIACLLFALVGCPAAYCQR